MRLAASIPTKDGPVLDSCLKKQPIEARLLVEKQALLGTLPQIQHLFTQTLYNAYTFPVPFP